MSESARKAEVVEIELEPHLNADSLSLVKLGGYQCVVNTEQWKGVKLACYLPPETIVQTNKPEFSFLKREGRDEEVIRAKKLRQEWSVGLLVPAPDFAKVGDNLWDHFELKHYEPEEHSKLNAGDCATAPSWWANVGKYDLENFRRYNEEFIDGELVGLTQKYHGSFWSATYSENEYHVKSRGFWRKDDGNDYRIGLNKHESILKFMKEHENFLLCGELVGKIQKGYHYNVPVGECEVRLFDIRKPDYSYMNVHEFRDTVEKHNLPSVKILGGSTLVPFSNDLIMKEVDGKQPECPQLGMEGLVIRPEQERFSKKLNGRLILKCVSNFYLERQK